MRKNKWARPVALVVTAAASFSACHAGAYPIVNDTFLDSGWTPHVVNGVDQSSYGADSKIKSVSSGFSNGFPTPTQTHALIQFSPAFWTALASTPTYQEVDVLIYPYNNSLGLAADGPYNGYRDLELHPLTRGYSKSDGTAGPGDGIQSNAQKQQVYSDNGGPTWASYDGNSAHTWTTAGGDFVDLTSASPGVDFVLAKDPTVPGVTTAGKTPQPFVFNITPLLQNPALLTDLETYGALIRVTDEYNPPSGTQDFTSMVSSDDTAAADANYLPSVVIVTPEPASLAATGCVVAALLGRRRKRR